MSEKETIQQKPRATVIEHLKGTRLVSLKGDIARAITAKKQIEVRVNSREPTEILKGTYVAKTISKSGYACRVNFSTDRDEIEWICDPSNE